MKRSLENYLNIPVLCSFFICIALIPPLLIEYFSSQASYAEIHSYIDRNGKIHLTNQELRKKKNKKFLVDANNPYSKEMEHYAAIFSVPAALIQAIVKVESNFNPYSVSKKGAMGLMQLMPQTAKELGVKNAFLPKENLRGGTKYLHLMLKKNPNLDQALAAYNAGPGMVRKFRGVPPYRETRNYIRKVKHYYHRYSSQNHLNTSFLTKNRLKSSSKNKIKKRHIKEINGKFLYVINAEK